MTHSLWLAQVDGTRPVLAVRGVRAALRLLGGPTDGPPETPRGSIRMASDLVRDVRESSAPMMIGAHADPGVVETAHAALQFESQGAALGAVDLSPEEALTWEPQPMPTPDAEKATPAPEPNDPSDDKLTHEVYQTALVCLHMADGNVMNAAIAARLLGQAQHDTAWYDNVGRALGKTFSIRDNLDTSDDDD